MSRVCAITSKNPMSGHNVSHAKNRTPRRFEPNLHKKRVFVPELGKDVVLRLSAKGLRIIDKLGPYEAMKKAGLLRASDIKRAEHTGQSEGDK